MSIIDQKRYSKRLTVTKSIPLYPGGGVETTQPTTTTTTTTSTTTSTTTTTTTLVPINQITFTNNLGQTLHLTERDNGVPQSITILDGQSYTTVFNSYDTDANSFGFAPIGSTWFKLVSNGELLVSSNQGPGGSLQTSNYLHGKYGNQNILIQPSTDSQG